MIILYSYLCTSERDSKKGYCILRAHLQMGIDIIWRCGGGCGVIYRWKNIIMLMCINARVSEYLSETELLHACSSVWTSEKLRGGKAMVAVGFFIWAPNSKLLSLFLALQHCYVNNSIKIWNFASSITFQSKMKANWSD